MLNDILPLPQRLALSYGPERSRSQLATLFAFDARLGSAVRQASEPIMGQMRLAWWRDQLRLVANKRERSDVLVVALDGLGGCEASLAELVDCWEGLLAETLDQAAIAWLVSARTGAIQAIGRVLGLPGIPGLGAAWAYADLATGFSDPDERNLVLTLARQAEAPPLRAPKELRPVAVLDGLARRSMARGGAPLLEGTSSLLLAMRLGLLGR